MADIYVWWIGADAGDERLLDEVRASVERTFRAPARLHHAAARPLDAFDARRGQHSSTRILGWLLGARPRHAGKMLAITDVDLFIPILTYVFGEAQLGGLAAVVSTARLGGGLGSLLDARLTTARVIKEAVHELGHTFGLIHCATPRCVMTRSASVADVDNKSAALCHDCRIRYGELQDKGTDEHE